VIVLVLKTTKDVFGSKKFRTILVLLKNYLIPLYPPLSKGGNIFSSLWSPTQSGLWPGGQREVGRDFKRFISNC
jgi:hypothetical protein